MQFNFSLKETQVYKAARKESFFVFKYSDFLQKFFFFFFLLSLLFVLFSFSGFFSLIFAIKTSVLFFVLFLFFWNISLFSRYKIKKPNTFLSISEAISNPKEYNLAEFVSFSCVRPVDDCIRFCLKRNLSVNTASLFHSLLKYSNNVNIVCFRLGIDVKKLKDDFKNYSEKMQKREGSEVFSEDFKQTVFDALKISVETGSSNVGEKEILISLARHSEFFKKVLMDFDLKEKDVENMAMWLDLAGKSLEHAQKFWLPENLSKAGSFGKDMASGFTINLDQFSIDWTRVVSRWTFKEVIGHKKEIEGVEMILARSSLANALIIGEPGTGRKSIVQAIAQRCYAGASLPELNNKRIVELDLVQLSARIQNLEKLEDILDQIFYESASAGNVILVIDELHNFVEQKSQRAGAIDISVILAIYLANPNFKFIAVTTFDGLHRCIEKNRSFAEFFRKIEVSEISEQETIRFLQDYALQFEQKNKILILYPSLREIVNLTARYMPSLPFPKKAADVLDESVVYLQTLREKVLLPHHIAEIISQKTEIPVGKMDVKEKEVLLNLEKLIHQRIVNQEEAVKEISISLRRARAGIGNKKRPMGTFLFMGPTGVGKTETSKALAEIYFGSGRAKEERMIRLDMSEFQSISDIPRLIGSVSPVEMQGALTTPVRETPFSLVLVDEIEKSHSDILNLFLQILDEGHITDGQGRKVVFTNTIIICTSNAGADIIFKETDLGKKIDKEKFISSLVEKGTFRPEFINRFDATVIFHPLTKENLLDISEMMLQSLKKNLLEKEIIFEITEELKEKIVDLSFKPEFGAREMRRVVQDTVENSIASALLADKLKKGDSISIDPENFSILITKAV